MFIGVVHPTGCVRLFVVYFPEHGWSLVAQSCILFSGTAFTANLSLLIFAQLLEQLRHREYSYERWNVRVGIWANVSRLRALLTDNLFLPDHFDLSV